MITARDKGSPKIRPRWLVLLAVVGLVVAACSTGSYPVDVFTEMHYQQSYKSQEPPRLAPAQGAVPFALESEPLLPIEPASQAEALAMANPVPRSSETEEQGRQIFIRNCSMCHGLDARGSSFMVVTFNQLGVNPPSDLTTAPSLAPSNPIDGLPFWLITDGIINMPSFRNLLTQEERWTVIHYLRFLSESVNQ
ncbi:MAG: cytochrome c [Dehalococcoidia bacterium]